MTELQLGTIVQVAYIVDDAETAAAEFAATTGAGPFFIRRNPVTGAHGPDGRAGSFDHTSAYGQWGRLQIELVQVHSAEPAEFAATTRERNRIHHVAMMVPSFSQHQRKFAEIGWPAMLSASTRNGNNFAFHDARPQLGHLVEIYEPRPTIVALYQRVAAAAEGWDGRDPVHAF